MLMMKMMKLNLMKMIYKYKIRVHKDEDDEMINAKVDDFDNGDGEVTDAAKADTEKTSKVKDDAKKTELSPTSPSLSVSSGFGNQFLKLSFDFCLVSTVKDNSDADQIPESSKKQTPTVDLEQGSEKSASEILKIKREQTKKQKTPKFTIKSTNQTALIEYDQKSILYQTMHAHKSFNRNPANHRLYHALMEALIEDENAIDKGVANTVQDHKRKHDDDEDDDDDEDPPAGPNQVCYGEPVEEPIAEVIMDDAGDHVVHDDDQPQDTSEPKTAKTPNPKWFTQPPRPPTPDPEWNKHQLDWNNPEGDCYPFDLSKPLPLQGPPGHQTITVDYLFNNDLEYLKTYDLEVTYTTFITKKKAARYEIEGIEDMVPTLWSPTKLNKFSKHNVYATKKILSVKKLHGYGHLEEIMVKRADRQLYKFKEAIPPHHIDIVDFIVALCIFTRSLVIKKRVEDLQLRVESYQKKLNITPPQQTVPEIEFKEPYTPSHKPPGVIYEDLVKQK
ncbi:hypothetical protein Tco_1367768 [Tanacetum coccineum]